VTKAFGDVKEESEGSQNKNHQREANMPKRASLMELPPESRLQISSDVIRDDLALMTLPESLRMYIEYAEDRTSIDTGATNHLQPALLRSSSQLRQDTMQLFHDLIRNYELVITIEDLKFAPQPGHWVWHIPNHKPISIMESSRSSDDSWSNVLDWLRLYHAGITDIRTDDLAFPRWPHPMHHFVIAIFDNVDSMRDCAWADLEVGLLAWGDVFYRTIDYPSDSAYRIEGMAFTHREWDIFGILTPFCHHASCLHGYLQRSSSTSISSAERSTSLFLMCGEALYGGL